MIRVLVLLVLFASTAWAHGDAQWIADGKYMDDEGFLCCGVSDCSIAPEGAVTRTADGWVINETNQLFRDNAPGLHESIDEHVWWCLKHVNGEKHYRCLFIRPEGV